MIENLKKTDHVEPDSKKIEDEVHDTISELFRERDQTHLAGADESVSKDAKEALAARNPSENPAVRREDSQTPQPTNADETSEIISLKEELLKNRKVITDTQRFGRQNARKLKNALKITQELVTSGSLSREEAQSLVESLESGDSAAATEVDVFPYDSHPFANILKVANAELVNLRKYSDDQLLDDKIKAFDYFLSVAPQEDIAESFEVLNDLIEDPVKLAKQMLNIGKRYYDESYKDIASAGGIAQYIKSKHEEIEKLNKSIDKLTKKLAQYEDFDKPRYRIAEVGNGVDGTGGVKDTISALFEERDRVKRR